MDRAEQLPPAPACPPLDEARAAVRDVMAQTQAPLGTNLGDLFKRALKT